MTKPAILLTGGLDPQGCAGIAADLATAQHHDCHGLPLITAMTEQTSSGMTSFGAVSAKQFLSQYHNCVKDYQINAIKIGLIPNSAIARCIVHIVKKHAVPVVFDPVFGSTSGGIAVDKETQDIVINELLPHITLITPNLPELQQLQGLQSVEKTTQDWFISGLQACLIKGGHADEQWATDQLISPDIHCYLYQQRYPHSVRGTGCVLATAIACHLAAKQDIRDAVVLAKAYISRGIRLAQSAGPYRVVQHHQEPMQLIDMPKLCYHAAQIGQQYAFPACPERLGIYPVVDSSDWVHKLVNEGVQTIQLRVKSDSAAHIAEEINDASRCIVDSPIQFFINDHWPQAIEVGAYGVHLGQEDLHDANLAAISDAGLRLGVSTHSYWELSRALAINPSYIALGPIYATTSKQMPFSPQGKDRLQEWLRLLKDQYPVVAIGGINLERATALKTTGVGSVAMISAITQAADYRQATRELLALWQE